MNTTASAHQILPEQAQANPDSAERLRNEMQGTAVITNDQTVREPAETETHAIHIRNVPLEIWQKARLNAVLSNLPVKLYLMRLIKESSPFPLNTGERQSA